MSLDHNTQSHNDDKEPAIETSLQGQQNQGSRVMMKVKVRGEAEFAGKKLCV